MKFKLNNTLTRKVEDFRPISGEARVYSCGPTIYDHIHIGNLSSFIFADNINRALKLAGHNVKHVMNLTDIDDKTIVKSHTEYPEDSPEVALSNLTNKYEQSFKDDMILVGNNIEVLSFIKATDSIELMQKLILELLEKGFAYIADDGIYFSIEEYQKDNKVYGQLLELDISNTSKARINNDEYDKHSIHDFALWKFIRPNEPAWPFEINGKDYLGRPGWHIECSAMSMHTLGEPFDIHTGGVDLIFPHHENEIAQSTAGRSDPTYAKIFAHNEHLLIDRKKMSKSLGNVFNLRDIIEKGYDPLAYRLLVNQSHYRNQANFNWDLLDGARSRLVDLKNMAALKFQTKNKAEKNVDYKELDSEIREAFLDDLNTPKVLAIVSAFSNLIQDDLVNSEDLDVFNSTIELIDKVLGLNLVSVKDISQEQKELLEDRDKVRNDKDWAKSDELRDSLSETGISVRDTSLGQVWSYLT